MLYVTEPDTTEGLLEEVKKFGEVNDPVHLTWRCWKALPR